MKEKEFRRLGDFLRKKSVEIYIRDGIGELSEFEDSGYYVLWSSRFGNDVLTGDCKTIVIARLAIKGKPTERILLAAKEYGREFVDNEQYKGDPVPDPSRFTIDDMFNAPEVPKSEWPDWVPDAIKQVEAMGDIPSVIRKKNGEISVVTQPHFEGFPEGSFH